MTTAPTTSAEQDEAGEVKDLVAFGRALAQRRAVYEATKGPVPVPRNSGTRRTASKKALLKAIEVTGKRW